MNGRWVGYALCLSCLAAATAAVQAQPADAGGYTVVNRWNVGGEGGWDYLTADAGAHRLYYGRSTRMQALDLTTGQVAGEVPGTPGIHGVALVPNLGRGFTSNGRDSSVTIFDTRTFATIARVPTDGVNPDAIAYDPVSKRVFVFNGRSRDATVLDAGTGRIVGSLALDGRPDFAAADGTGHMYVNIEDSSAVVRFDTRTLKISGRWPIAPGEEPSGLALDVAHHRVFSVCANEKLMVLDSESGRVVGEIPIGKGVDATAFDPGTGLLFSSNGEGTLTVIHEDSPDHYTVLETVPTQRGARTMALDPKTHHVYVAAAEYGETPAPTADRPHPRPPMVPGSFVILELAKK